MMEVVADWLYSIDVRVLRWINTVWVHPWLDWLMGLVSDFNTFKWILGVSVLALLIFGKFRERTLIVLMALCLLIGDAGINWAIKRTVNRPRPHETHEGLRVVDRSGVRPSQPREFVERGRSMTSGHVCNNVALGFLVTWLYPRWGWMIWFWVVLVSYSRIYNASHYPSDVLVSFLVAMTYTWLIVLGSQWLWERAGSRWWPDFLAKHPVLVPRRTSQ